MPLFQRKTGRVNPTRHWVGDTRFPLELDLSRASLSGVGIGAPIEGLMRLGPAEDPEAAEDEILKYFSRGLEITAEDGFITGYRILLAPGEGFQSFPGVCLYRGEEAPLSAATIESEISALFGEPFWRDEDEEEILLFYEPGRIEWQMELSKDGTLRQLSIVSPPLMADSVQRDAYGVIRAWPPASSERIRPRFAEALLRTYRVRVGDQE